MDRPASVARRPIRHLRWYIAVLLCCASELNYLDRQALSVLADTLQRELGLTTRDYANITSAFLISYTVMYAVSGRIVDVVGSRRTFLVFVSAWSGVTMLHALARNAVQFAVVRFLLGMAEPANFPAGVRAVSEWFPMRERALAVGIFNAGTALGSTAAVPAVSFIALYYGWRLAFVLSGALGFIWVAIWAAVYRLPAEHPRLAPEERALLSEGQSSSTPDRPPAITLLLRRPQTWGCVAARALTDPITYFLTFWIPVYLQQERGFTLSDIGAYGWIPFFALTIGNIAAGAIPRALVARGWAVDRARKTTMLTVSLVILVSYLALREMTSPTWAMVCITAIFFGHAAWGNIILPAEIFPARAVGTVSGLGGSIGGVVGILTQQAIGRVVETAGYAPVFLAAAFVYLAAYGLVVWLCGELGQIIPLGDEEEARA
ncbi:MAG: MFS transporter [Luteitalea sp.]|nr:MFS transporter [Luteitalea sp.]